jgi:DNA-3-methyladenine glycosylase I
MADYHDREWGRPVREAVALFERLCLESFQSGLSWRLILSKRPAFRRAFSDFDPPVVASYNASDVDRLLADEGIVRNRRKIEATIANAQAFLLLSQQGQSFSELLWSFVGGRPVQPNPRPTRLADLPSATPESKAMARALKDRGFRHIGPTTCYAMMQATGMVDDHLAGCFVVTGRKSDA